MNLLYKQKSSGQYALGSLLRILSLSLIIFLLSFPKLSPVMETGLDSSANYAFNYFFANGIQTGVDIIFTYGPLGFMKAPLPMGNNLIYAILLLSVMRFLFIFLILFIGNIINPQKWLLHFFIALIIAQLIGFDLLILGIIIASLIICYERKYNGIWFFVAVLFCVLGMFIKASIGINGFLISGLIYLEQPKTCSILKQERNQLHSHLN